MRRTLPDGNAHWPVPGGTYGLPAPPVLLESGLALSRLAGLRGFTRLDLLAVVAVLGLLFLLVLPALARPGLNSKSFQCLNNHRQLCNAWRLYADDNNDRIVYASHNGNFSDPMNKHAWTWSEMDFSPNPKNWDTNADIVLRPLWPYTARNAAIHKCPEDQSYVMTGTGVAKPRVRSLSMNFYLGGYAGTDAGIASAYRLFLKSTELTDPGPAKTFVFIDQRADSINWGNFLTSMTGYSPHNPAVYTFSPDFPGLLHDGAAAISFADGHTELHRWTDPRTTPPLSPNGIHLASSEVPSPRNPDIVWLQDHATRPK